MTLKRSNRFTKVERSWIFYDWANSVYATIIMAAVFPIYFVGVAKGSGASGDVWWGFGTSLATLTLAVLAPILGAIGDFHGMKKKLFSFFLLLGLVFTTTMALTDNWRLMLVGYIFSYIGFAGSLLFYDSFLTDVTTADRMDRVSAWGYAMGYLGGSTIPFLVSIAMILFYEQIGISKIMAVKISCLLCVVWWAVFSLPILFHVHQTHYEDKPKKDLIKISFSNIWRTLQEIFHNKAIFTFMLAYFFYIDGVNTVIHMATAYGSSLGLGDKGMILALLVTQVVAVPFSIFFSHLSQKIGSIRMISIAIVVYFIICSVGFYMGFSLEPSQTAYTQKFEKMVQQSVEQADLGSLSAADQAKFQTSLDQLLLEGKNILADDSRADDFAQLLKTANSAAEKDFSSAAAQSIVKKALGDVEKATIPFLKDTAAAADFTKALSRSEMLFWAMAVLVGTCQGGIQALSRSFFGKLIPANRSSEYFGFFDIFGKFAAVMGPALYSLIANLSGRSSYGILSLMLLFAIGLLTITIGRRPLRQAEQQAMEAVRQSQEKSAT